MLTSLQIQNFKCWQDTGEIRMAPLTLFFGTNSSGKSSIGQFLMMLKQTMEWPDRKTVLYPGDRNSTVDLGSFSDMVFHHDLGRQIQFGYEWILPDGEKLEIMEYSRIKMKKSAGARIQFSACIGSTDKTPAMPMLESFMYALGEHSNSASVGMSWKPTGTRRKNSPEAAYYLEPHRCCLLKKPGDFGSQRLLRAMPIKFYGFPDEIVAHYNNTDFIYDFNFRHEQLFRTISYLGPLRTKTERIYAWPGGEPGDVGYDGRNTIPAILAAKNRKLKFSLRNKKSRKSFQAFIAAHLKEMGLIESFEVHPISAQRHEYEVKVRTKGSKDAVDLPDVGFGVSQVLPVLVQCFYAPPNSILIMEQPEIHLHPSAQSALADVMIDAIHAKENGRDRNIQLIVETHSEHFLRRLQRRIAEGVIDESKVACYYADTSRASAKLKPLDVDMFGNIRNWPENFFGDEMGDIAAQSKAALKRRGKQ